MGKVCEEYSDYEKSKSIGSGGFGEVYRYTEELAIKQEFKVRNYAHKMLLKYVFIVYMNQHIFLYLETTYYGKSKNV